MCSITYILLQASIHAIPPRIHWDIRVTQRLDQMGVEGYRFLALSTSQLLSKLLGLAYEGGPQSEAYIELSNVSYWYLIWYIHIFYETTTID